MRRVLAVIGVAGLAVAAVVLMGAGGDGGHYRVRAIFDNAAFLVPGEDVKVAGVRVGKIDGLSVTPDKRAAVVLDIEDPGYQDFRADATCKIRPQSLIGEQFVDCTPTQPRASTDPEPPALRRIEDGPGEGQYLLPVEQTSASVALDLLGNVNRLPVRERLTLILNELGTGLAGRGADLNAVIRRAAPALQELDQVLDILAEQNRTLERLAVDSDRIMAPLARERKHVTGFITSAQKAAAATAEKRAALEETLQKLPTFLAELRPTMQRLGDLARQGTPVAADLRAAAGDIDALVSQLGPFSAAATPALTSLGAVGERGIPALQASLPIVQDLRRFAHRVRPVGAKLADVLESFRDKDGIPDLLTFVYHSALAINGFDGVSHFLRAGLLVNTCSNYAVDPQPECLAKFSGFDQTTSPTSASAASAGERDKVLQDTAAVLAGADPEDLRAADTAAALAEQRAARDARKRTTAPVDVGGGAALPEDTTGDVMDFLFGTDAP